MMLRISFLAGAAVAACLVFVQPAAADGALFIAKAGSKSFYGWSMNTWPADKAQRIAKESCEEEAREQGYPSSQCRLSVTIKDKCFSVAKDDQTEVLTWALEVNRADSDRKAMASCARESRSCEISYSSCDMSDIQKCNGVPGAKASPAEAMAACARIIQSRNATAAQIGSAHYNRGVLFQDKGDLTAALDDYNKSIAAHPKDADAYFNRALIFERQKDLPRALADYTRSIELNPNLDDAYNNRGIVHLKADRPEDALRDFNKALELNPKSHKALNSRGELHLDNKDYDKALQDFMRAAEADPSYAPSFKNRGIAYFYLGDMDKAIESHTRAISLRPDYDEAFRHRGNAKRKMGHFQAALEDLTKAMQIDPADALYVKIRGDIYTDTSDWTPAIADYTKALEIDAKYDEAYRARGDAYRRMGEFERALADYTRAAEIDPKDPTYVKERGHVYRDMGEYGRAIEDYRRAVERKPDDVESLAALGYGQFYAGEYTAAAASFLRAIEREDNKYTMLFRAIARARNGEDAAAELEANAGRLKDRTWPYAVIEHLLGKRSPQATVDSASSDDERCEAHFYIGQLLLAKGATEDGLGRLKTSVQTCPKDFIEYHGALAELKRRGR